MKQRGGSGKTVTRLTAITGGKTRERPKHEPRCGVCCLHVRPETMDLDGAQEYRARAETNHARGLSYAGNYRDVSNLLDGWPRRLVPSLSSLERHLKHHAPATVHKARELVFARMAQLNVPVEDAAVEAYADVILDPAYMLALQARDLIATGEVKVSSVGDALKAIEFFRAAYQGDSPDAVPRSVVMREFQALLGAVRRRLPREQFDELMKDWERAKAAPEPRALESTSPTGEG
jgi:hypothetical protein